MVMKLVALVLLAVALATTDARRLSWEDMVSGSGDMSMGYPIYPGAGAYPTAKAVASASAYPSAYPAYPTYPTDAVGGDAAAGYPYPAHYPAYPVDPKVDTDEEEEEEEKPHPGCFFKTDFSCEPKKCGGEECKFPNKCTTVKKLVEKEVVIDAPCPYPKLACKEILTPCGPEKDELNCKFDETCESEEVCKKEPYAYGPYYKLICEDKFSCEKIDPKVCETVEHQVCIARDPKAADPGFFNGYALGWQPGYKYGMKCGDKVCQYGSFCATCEVEVCKENVIPKEAAKCGFDPNKKVPTFCPPGHMCVELCPQIKKKVVEVVEEDVCVHPYDAHYPISYQPVVCGDKKCAPGYECKEETCELCPYYYPYGYADAAADDSAEYPTYGYPYPGYPTYPYADAAADDSAEYPTYGYPYPGYPTYPYEGVDSSADDMKTDPTYGYPYYPYAQPMDVSSNGDNGDNGGYYVPYKPTTGGSGMKDPHDYAVYEPVPKVDDKEEKKGKKSTAYSASTATAEPDKVSVWGESKTAGDGSATFKATAKVPDEDDGNKLLAKIIGGSGPDDTSVDCYTESADGISLCDGVAAHDEDD